MRTLLGGVATATWALVAATLLGGCLDATQIAVELHTDVKCADRPETTISVGTLGQLESSAPVAVTTACDAQTGRIGSIVVLPHDSKEGQVGIEVVAGIVKSAEECRRDNFVGGCIVARRSLNFVKHHGLELPIELEAACIDVPCGATETCRRGACVPAQVDPNSCYTSQGCSIADPGAGAGGVGGAGGMGGVGVGGWGAGGGGASGGTSGGGEGEGGSGALGSGGTSAIGGSAGQAAGGAAGQEPTTGGGGSGEFGGFGGQGGTIAQSGAGFGGQGGGVAQGGGGQGSAGGAGGLSSAGGQAAGGSAGKGGQGIGGSAGHASGGGAGAGGGPPFGPVLLASDFKSSTGNVSSISPSKALLPEQPGDLLLAWVCITSELGFATPQNSSFWTAYTNAPGVTLVLAQVRCQLFTAIATGGSESHAFNVFPASAVSIQRLEFKAAKPLSAPAPADSGYPTTTPTTSAMAIAQNHSALVYFFGVSGSTTLGSINIGAGAQATVMQQITAGGVNQLTSGIALASDQPAGTAPKVTYAPANSGVWSSAGVVISPNP
ncbi:MAG TPA: hypothetical protein VER96_39670 [Polyangiaceae bacterium]|nr:hypothetical protein [Polyangiaceae bacterium]